MHLKTNILKTLFIFFGLTLLSTQVFADCLNACTTEHNNCLKTATNETQKNRCEELSNVCNLNCNRDKTMYCTYLGFKDHDGKADKEKELEEITGGFTRVTSDGRPHFGGLCSHHNLKCNHVIAWDKQMYMCGGDKREPRRVACCR